MLLLRHILIKQIARCFFLYLLYAIEKLQSNPATRSSKNLIYMKWSKYSVFMFHRGFVDNSTKTKVIVKFVDKFSQKFLRTISD